MMRDFAGFVSRVAGSVGVWLVGGLIWLFIGFAWFCVIVWNQRARLTDWILVLLAIGIAGTVGLISLPLCFALGEWVGELLGRC